jgi:hypothetical protein
MVQRRAEAAGLDTHIYNHAWRGTGITTYLENGGTLENVAKSISRIATQIFRRIFGDPARGFIAHPIVADAAGGERRPSC